MVHQINLSEFRIKLDSYEECRSCGRFSRKHNLFQKFALYNLFFTVQIPKLIPKKRILSWALFRTPLRMPASLSIRLL